MDTPQHLVKRLNEDAEKTLDFFQALSPEQWEQAVYTEGSCWTVRQIMAHFSAAENSLLRLVGNILGGGAGAPENFDLNAYNERKVAGLLALSSAELLERFSRVRGETVALVAGMQPADLARQGRHPFLGVASLAEIIRLIYRHNQIHIREIRQSIQKK